MDKIHVVAKPHKLSYVSIVLLIIVLLPCCFIWNSQETIPPKYVEFFKLPLQKQLEVFDTYPLETQFEISIVETTIEPPHSGFSRKIASKGEIVLPFLLNKIENSQDEDVLAHIIEIFDYMNEFYYPLNKKEDVTKSMKKAIQKMKIASIKQRSEEILKKIQKNN